MASIRRWIVRGRVQGVAFRAFTRRAARELGVRGWVRNQPDGSVEIRVSGADTDLEQLLTRVRRGPVAARVEEIEETSLSTDDDFSAGFDIVF